MSEEEMIGTDYSGVYFIRNNKNNNIKIGCSKNINKRYKELVSNVKQIGEFSVMFEIVNYVECSDYNKLEKHIHNIFADKRIENEWFGINVNEISDLINKIDLSNFVRESKNQYSDFYTIGKIKYLSTLEVKSIEYNGKVYFSTNIIPKSSIFHNHYNRLETHTKAFDDMSNYFKEGSATPIRRDENGIIYYDIVSLVNYFDTYVKTDLYSDRGMAELYYKPLFEEMNKFISAHQIVKIVIDFEPSYYEILKYSFPNFSELEIERLYKNRTAACK